MMANFGYVGYCHLGTARVWAESFEECKAQAETFKDANPKYMTRKGIKIVELVKENKVK